MKRTISICLAVLAFAVSLTAQHDHHAAASVHTLKGMGQVHHQVTTSNPVAQAFFDQGLALVYGFNHDEAGNAFRKAAELDPKLAMAYWGVALVHGSNYNLPSMPDREKAAAEAIKKAVALAPGASQLEQDYIAALANRYSDDPKADLTKLAVAYRDAMRALVQKYPDDLDAATLFAESNMDLSPWDLWTQDGKPKNAAEEIVATLESVLKRDPNHLGANHYYIHAVEASPFPERALASANRLAALSPGAGHLVHMPAHIYIRTGDHEKASQTNVAAAAADEAYFKDNKAGPVYQYMYYPHNIHFQANSEAMEGRYAAALAAAQKLEKHVTPMAKDMPMVGFFLPTEAYVLVRFGKWDEVLALQAPPDLPLSTPMWHFARGMAFAGKGKLAEAEQECAILTAAHEKIDPAAMAMRNPVKSILAIGVEVLTAKIAEGHKDYAAAEKHLRAAVDMQAALGYIEPPEWFWPVRENLGGLLLRQGRAADAEKVFRADLDWNPRNGRSLFGLAEALKMQKRAADASAVEAQLKAAWKNADTKLSVEAL